MHGTKEASNDGRVRVRIIHGLNISHKELTYLLQKFISPRSKVLLRMLLGEGLVGVNHRTIPTATQRKTINKYFMLRLRYITVHHTCMLQESQTSTQLFLQSTITHEHESNITIFISQNYCMESNISYSMICKFYVGFYD